ncbi:MAG: GNAT family N-acetyltransferase [Treponema sp.]|jgi:predicted GNAT family acetyltransferase|nr:GNAT family N-acetyltransferase [Treponema sp.]
MNDGNFNKAEQAAVGKWRKMGNRDSDIYAVETLLRAMEKKCVSACARFLALNETKGNVWTLNEKSTTPSALLINSRSTIIPVLCGKKEIPCPDFLKELIKKNKIHSVQGQKEDVLILEKKMKQMGAQSADIYDYDLMSLDRQPNQKTFLSVPSNLVLRTPRLTDLDAIAPLQAAYEQEEVLPSGSDFSPAASRINLANIIARGQMLCAEVGGRLVGKININAVSFTRYQLGGVYVHPDFRRQGIARGMAAEFISSIIKEGRGVTLFVKKSNPPAQRLYSALGFTVSGDYRITYY